MPANIARMTAINRDLRGFDGASIGSVTGILGSILKAVANNNSSWS
jgi:hypothetical protein